MFSEITPQLPSIESELQIDGPRARLLVRTDEPVFREALRRLAFSETDEGFARVGRADSPDPLRIADNFERHAEELLLQAAGLRPAPWAQALRAVLERLGRSGLAWFLSGSAALAVRGIDAAPRDLDLVVSDAERAAEVLADVLIEPLLYDADRAWIASWFGRAFLHARVEWIADVYPEYDEWGSPNETGPQAASRLEAVSWEGYDLQLTPLDLQLAVNEKRGLDERVAAIRRFLAHRS